MFGVMAPADLRAQGVSVISPNGGEVRASGASTEVSWAAPDGAVNFKLQYSIDNGATWRPIVSGTVTGSSYEWTVPAQAANKTNCLVRVTGFDSDSRKIGVSRSAKPFTIEVVKIVSPNGGETLAPGVIQTVAWTTHGTVREVARVNILKEPV